MKNMTLIAVLLLTSILALAQQEQAGNELTRQFPNPTDGNVEPDLPANGFWWDKNNPGMGINLEIQKRPASSTGYFMFLAGYFYDENHKQFWCVVSEDFKFNTDVHQWRTQRDFSNLFDHSGGHDEPSLLAEQDVTCYVMQGGSPLGNNTPSTNQVQRTLDLHLVFRSPTELELTAEGGEVQHFSRLAMHDNLTEPSMDWIMDYEWVVNTNFRDYFTPSNGDFQIDVDRNQITKFHRLDIEQHPDIKEYVGHKDGWVYYISNTRPTTRDYFFYGLEYLGTPAYEPVLGVPFSHRGLIMLIYDPSKQRVMYFRLGGYEAPGQLDPNTGSMAYAAKVNPNAEVLSFYPYFCEGKAGNNSEGWECEFSVYYPEYTSSTATWSQNSIKRDSVKMFRLNTGAKAYEFQGDSGECTDCVRDKVKAKMEENDILPYLK